MDDIGGAAAIVAAPVVVIAGVLLGVFFATGREAWGRANDVASVVFALLLVPVAVAADAGGAWKAVTAAGLVAMAVAAVASGLTAAGRLTVAQLTVWQGGAFAALFVWVAGVSAERLPDALGWLGIAAAVRHGHGRDRAARTPSRLRGSSDVRAHAARRNRGDSRRVPRASSVARLARTRAPQALMPLTVGTAGHEPHPPPARPRLRRQSAPTFGTPLEARCHGVDASVS